MHSNLCLGVALLFVIDSMNCHDKPIRRRQIYREEVLPYAGGKIPETAFETDRLLLNRLQKEGIAIPDGVILQQRSPRVYAYAVGDSRPVIRIEPTSDERYTPPEGQFFHYEEPLAPIETTYPVPDFTYSSLSAIAKTIVRPPIYREFSLPNALLADTPFKPKISTPNAFPNYPVQNENQFPGYNYEFPSPADPNQPNLLPVHSYNSGALPIAPIRRSSTVHGNVKRFSRRVSNQS